METLPRLDVDKGILVPALLRQLDPLRAAGMQVQSQPLGFMRLALEGQPVVSDGHFLHVWMPGLPTQEGGPFLHTHAFDLTSRIIRGTITDTLYDAFDDENGLFRLVQATSSQQTAGLTKALGKVRLDVRRVLTKEEGGIYAVAKDTFHSTDVDKDKITITVMRKSNTGGVVSNLAVPLGVNLDQPPFRRDQIDQVFAWRKIRELLEECL